MPRNTTGAGSGSGLSERERARRIAARRRRRRGNGRPFRATVHHGDRGETTTTRYTSVAASMMVDVQGPAGGARVTIRRCGMRLSVANGYGYCDGSRITVYTLRGWIDTANNPDAVPPPRSIKYCTLYPNGGHNDSDPVRTVSPPRPGAHNARIPSRRQAGAAAAAEELNANGMPPGRR